MVSFLVIIARRFWKLKFRVQCFRVFFIERSINKNGRRWTEDARRLLVALTSVFRQRSVRPASPVSKKETQCPKSEWSLSAVSS